MHRSRDPFQRLMNIWKESISRLQKLSNAYKQHKSKSKAAAYYNVLFCNLTKFYKTIACKLYAQSFMPFPQHGMGPKSRPKKASKTSLRKLHKICFSTRIPGKMQNLRRLSKVGNIQYIRMDQVIFDIVKLLAHYGFIGGPPPSFHM